MTSGSALSHLDILSRLRRPRVPEPVRRLRTRHVNRDLGVVAARRRVDALLAPCFTRTDLVRRALERRLAESGETGADIALRVARNPAAFDRRWRGRRHPKEDVRPSPDELGPALGRLAAALEAARTRAIALYPANYTPRWQRQHPAAASAEET